MAVSGVYNALDEATLVKMREDVLAELDKARTGKRFASVSGGGKAFAKDNMSIDALKEDLAEIMAALQLKNPTLYGRRARRMFVDFSSNGASS